MSGMENESKFTHNALVPSDFTDQSEPTRCKRDDATANKEPHLKRRNESDAGRLEEEVYLQ